MNILYHDYYIIFLVNCSHDYVIIKYSKQVCIFQDAMSMYVIYIQLVK